MTQCARPSGPEACTESIDLLTRGFSRGGMVFITPACGLRQRGVAVVGLHVLGRFQRGGDDLRHAQHQRRG